MGAFGQRDEDGNSPQTGQSRVARTRCAKLDATREKDRPQNPGLSRPRRRARYELVLMLQGQERIEGWTLVHPFWNLTLSSPQQRQCVWKIEEDRQWIEKDDSELPRHYENKAVPPGDGWATAKRNPRADDAAAGSSHQVTGAEMPGAATPRFRNLAAHLAICGGWVKELPDPGVSPNHYAPRPAPAADAGVGSEIGRHSSWRSSGDAPISSCPI